MFYKAFFTWEQHIWQKQVLQSVVMEKGPVPDLFLLLMLCKCLKYALLVCKCSPKKIGIRKLAITWVLESMVAT